MITFVVSSIAMKTYADVVNYDTYYFSFIVRHLILYAFPVNTLGSVYLGVE
jgi:hypothetical protein